MSAPPVLGGFDPIPSADWPAITAALVHPWPAGLAAHDLRWHAAQVRITADRPRRDHRWSMPGYREFAERWGWGAHRVRDLMRDEPRWADPLTHQPAQQPTHQPAQQGRINQRTRERLNADKSSKADAPTDAPTDAVIDAPTDAPNGNARDPLPHTTPITDHRSPKTVSDRPAIRRVALEAVAAIRATRDPDGTIRPRPLNPARGGADIKTISTLWAAEGNPDPDEFGADLLLVIAWARDSTDPLAARDIRAEGWANGTDRHRHLATICVQSRWSARVDAARLWDVRGRVDIVPRSREPDRTASNRPPPARTKGEAALESLLTINPNEVNPWLRPKQSAQPLPSSLAPDSTTLLPARQR